MQASEPDPDPMRQVFALSPDRDAMQLALTAAEGYLLSRIDGDQTVYSLGKTGRGRQVPSYEEARQRSHQI